jgi:glycogen debranching enzyme
MLTILDGSTFCVSDESGDFDGGVGGLFAEDTRMLSRCRVVIDGRMPLLLTARAVDYFHSRHFLRNAVTRRIAQDTLSITRERFIGRTLTEQLAIRNEGMKRLAFDLDIDLASDFADILSVKSHDFTFGDPERASVLPPDSPCVPLGSAGVLISDGSGYGTSVRFSRPPEHRDTGVRFSVDLEPHETWEITFEVAFSGDDLDGSFPTVRTFGSELQRVQETLAAWKVRIPRLETTTSKLQRAYERSVADLASLRLRDVAAANEFPAAGMPWFMTLFGRDTLITSLQTLLFGPELAAGALRALASLQAVEDDPSIDAEPGKILHELRRGKAAGTWFPLYYGTIDATPLFLILLSEVWRWTRDDDLVRELEQPALRALMWIDEHGDRDDDGFVEYERRTQRGLANQSWKDSGDSQRFRDGAEAAPPIAPAEVQGYVYDAKRRLAELARVVWCDPSLATRLDKEAELLAGRFHDAFWVEDRGTYALALDREKRQVDSLCSNIGHLLWSRIVPDAYTKSVVQDLTGPELNSGWGIRTMSVRDAAYSPLSYHNGTVWPHDTALAAWGLALNGYPSEAHELCDALLEAAAFFDYSLPEVFAGYDRSDTGFPVAYPTAARPQAWAAGAPVLCLTILLGLRPDPMLQTLALDDVPLQASLGRMTLDGIRAFGRNWRVEINDGVAEVFEHA